MVLGPALVAFFEKAILDLPNRADERGNLHPVAMAEVLRDAVFAAGAGTLAFETALKYLADAMAAAGVRNAADYLRSAKDSLSLDEAHAYLSHGLRLVRAL
jgi:hypothetical protein